MRKKWNKSLYNQLCKDVKADCMSEGISEECMGDIADNLLMDDPGLKEFIINELGAEDYKGRLANDI